MHPVLRVTERELACFIRRGRGDPPPAVRDVRLTSMVEQLALHVGVEFYDGRDLHFVLDERELMRDRAAPIGARELLDGVRCIYSRLLEDALIDRALDRVCASFRDRIVAENDPHVAAQLSLILWETEQELLRSHYSRHEPRVTVFGVDPGEGTSFDLRSCAINWVDPGEAAPVTATQIAQWNSGFEVIQREVLGYAPIGFSETLFGNEAARTKGQQLLREWLTPLQLAQYDRDRFFDVVGGTTGTRYRVREGRQQNVFELDSKSEQVCGLCFLPQGGLVAGDVMLAQKIALETDELAALRVANRFMDSRPRRPPVNSSAWTGRP